MKSHGFDTYLVSSLHVMVRGVPFTEVQFPCLGTTDTNGKCYLSGHDVSEKNLGTVTIRDVLS